MRVARAGPGAVVLGGRLVVLGGFAEGRVVGSVESYDPAEDAWDELPPMLTARAPN